LQDRLLENFYFHLRNIEASMRYRPIEKWIVESYRGSHRDHRTDVTSATGVSHALNLISESMWERRKWNTKSQSLANDGYGSSGGTPKKWGFECEKRLNAPGSRDTGEALRPVSSAATAIASLIQLIKSVHSN